LVAPILTRQQRAIPGRSKKGRRSAGLIRQIGSEMVVDADRSHLIEITS
jgi:hypothetical protein